MRLKLLCLGTLSKVGADLHDQLGDATEYKDALSIPGYREYRDLSFFGFALPELASDEGIQKTALQCANACSNKKECVAFVFQETEKQCKMKSGIGLWLKKKGWRTYAKTHFAVLDESETEETSNLEEHEKDKLEEQEEQEEEEAIKGALDAAGGAPPLHPGENCFEACGNQTGWCSWCGLAKACCSWNSASSVCKNVPSSFATHGYECVSPRAYKLTKLGLATFSFELQHLDYATVLAFHQLHKRLVQTVADAVVLILLSTVTSQQVSVNIKKSERGWVAVQCEVMIPEGGPAAGYLAETRLCFSAHSLELNWESIILETSGIDAARNQQGQVESINFGIGKGKLCPADILLDGNGKSRIEEDESPSWTLLLYGAVPGWLGACCLFSLCHYFCKPPPEPPQKLPLDLAELRVRSSGYSGPSPQVSPRATSHESEAALIPSNRQSLPVQPAAAVNAWGVPPRTANLSPALSGTSAFQRSQPDARSILGAVQ